MAQQKGNGAGVAEFASGTLVYKSNLRAIKIDTGIDLSGEDDQTREAVERVLSLTQPLVYQVISEDGTQDVINGQTEANYDGTGSNGSFVGGDGAGGTAHVALDVITLSDGTTVRVDAVDLDGDVTEFTITAVGGANSSEGATLTQAGSTGAGTDFSLTLGGDNVSGGGGVIHAVVDGSQVDSASLQAQLRAIGTDNVSGKVFTGATVVDAVTLTVA